MSEPKYEYLQVRITEMLLNSTNPRFNAVQHQTQAINAMIEDQSMKKNPGAKLVTLAEHILEYGLNPTDITLVYPHDKL